MLSALSTAAIILSLAGVLPQIAAMLRSRSSAGQSAVGWGMGVTVNVTMAYVNAEGYHAVLLAAGNVLACALCLAALACVLRLPGSTAPSVSPVSTFVDMPTGELMLVREAIVVETDRRVGNQAGQRANLELVAA